MFNLVVVVLTILLGAVLAIAGIYYGGSAFLGGAQKAFQSQALNGGQQVAAAVRLHATELGAPPASLTDLVTAGYLSSIPAGLVDTAPNPPVVLSGGTVAGGLDDAGGAWVMGAPEFAHGGERLRAFKGKGVWMAVDRASCLSLNGSEDEPASSQAAASSHGCYRIDFGRPGLEVAFSDGTPAYLFLHRL